MQADLLLRRGRIHPLGAWGLGAATRIAVAAGRVLAVGGEEVDGLRGPRTRTVDLEGRGVLPGFDDAHAHVVYYGLTSFGADLTGSRSLSEVARRIRRVHAQLPPGRWLVARGYSALELAERRAPTREELDAVVGNRPMYVDERGGHSRVANSAALAAAGLGSDTPDPPGGALGRRADGSLDGRLVESAMRLVADHQPPPELEERKAGIQRAQRLLLSRGITSVGAAVNRGFADDLRAFQELVSTGRLRMRVNEFLSWELLEASSRLGVGAAFGSTLLRAGPIKVFVDGGAVPGSVGLRGSPFRWRTPPDALAEIVRKATEHGLQVAAHAIGDAAIEAMCDAVVAAGPAARRLRHRVEHCTLCPPDLQRRLAALGMVAVMQPFPAALGRPGILAAFPPDMHDHLAAHRALRRAGVELAFSSDLPVLNVPDPWDQLRSAVLDARGGLTPLQAIRAYTSGGAYVAFQEAQRGTLAPGKWADFQVYDVDPLTQAVRGWQGLLPSAVAVGGDLAYGSL